MNVTQKLVVSQKVFGTAESHSRTLLKTRDLIDVSDEPVTRGGTNEGFAPTEFLLAGLAACTNVVFHKIAAKHGIEITALNISVDASFDRRGVTLEEEVDTPYPEIRLKIEIVTPANEDELIPAQEDLRKYCPVSKVISQSGTAISEEWIVSRPGVSED
jgi:putative redox protein